MRFLLLTLVPVALLAQTTPAQAPKFDTLPNPAGDSSGQANWSLNAQGEPILSWVETGKDGSDSFRYSVRHAGQWTAPRTIASKRHFFRQPSEIPGMVALSDGSFVAEWIEGAEGHDDTEFVYTAASKDGVTWSNPVMANKDKSQSQHGLASITASGPHEASVVWLQALKGDDGPASLSALRSTRAETFSKKKASTRTSASAARPPSFRPRTACSSPIAPTPPRTFATSPSCDPTTANGCRVKPLSTTTGRSTPAPPMPRPRASRAITSLSPGIPRRATMRAPNSRSLPTPEPHSRSPRSSAPDRHMGTFPRPPLRMARPPSPGSSAERTERVCSPVASHLPARPDRPSKSPKVRVCRSAILASFRADRKSGYAWGGGDSKFRQLAWL